LKGQVGSFEGTGPDRFEGQIPIDSRDGPAQGGRLESWLRQTLSSKAQRGWGGRWRRRPAGGTDPSMKITVESVGEDKAWPA